jgi:hypothetical protein
MFQASWPQPSLRQGSRVLLSRFRLSHSALGQLGQPAADYLTNYA